MLYGYDRLHLGVAPALEQSLCCDIFVQLAFRLCMDSNPSLMLWQVLWRERRLLVTHFWHRLVGTAGAWFFWCASASAITAKASKAELLKGCTCVLACPSAPGVHVKHQSVVATFEHGVNQEGTSASVKDTGGHAAHAVTQGRVILREQAVPVGVHRHHRARRVHPDGPAVDAAQLFCRTGTSPTHC